MATAGVLQYVNPTMQALMAVLILGEPLTHLQIAVFALIWLGLAIYAVPTRGRVAAG